MSKVHPLESQFGSTVSLPLKKRGAGAAPDDAAALAEQSMLRQFTDGSVNLLRVKLISEVSAQNDSTGR